jgi:hypothetical protein
VPRYAVEIKNCWGHHNALGYSGTAGDSVWVHDSKFTDNTTGIATDSAFPNHPGMPQNHSKFERNIIAHNNSDYYRHIMDGTCKKPFAERGYEKGVVCMSVGVPVGNGIINPAATQHLARQLDLRQPIRFRHQLVPGFVRNDMSWRRSSTRRTTTSTRATDGVPRLARRSQRLSWWDGQGVGSCWTSMSKTNIRTVPGCSNSLGTHGYFGEPAGTLKMYVCADYDGRKQRIPGGCDWYGAYAAQGFQRVEVRAATFGAALLAIVICLYLRRARRSRMALLGVPLGLAGLTVGIFGNGDMGSVLHPIGLAPTVPASVVRAGVAPGGHAEAGRRHHRRGRFCPARRDRPRAG